MTFESLLGLVIFGAFVSFMMYKNGAFKKFRNRPCKCKNGKNKDKNKPCKDSKKPEKEKKPKKDK